MPLIINGGRIPPCWARRNGRDSIRMREIHEPPGGCVRVALINNMPDPALEDTELQFFELLDAAADGVPVHVKLYSLPGIIRGERGQQHLGSCYFGLDDLWSDSVDGVIITGTEPHHPDLRHEPYWQTLADVLDWAEQNTASTVLSCLAAHAGVLHSDGIERHRLADKQFGVFEFERTGDHPIAVRTKGRARFPHSRWNELRADALLSCGYTVLTQSLEGGVDSFVKKKKKSLFVHFQGHPEYGPQTLLKEYRRDIKRFIRQERDTYPSMPKGYFDRGATKVLSDFQAAVLLDRREEKIAVFPEADVVNSLQNTWHSSARAIYRNWLQYMVSKKTEASAFPVIAAAYGRQERKRTVARQG